MSKNNLLDEDNKLKNGNTNSVDDKKCRDVSEFYKKFLSRKAVIPIFFLIVLYLFYLFVIPFVFNKFYGKQFVENKIFEASGYRINLTSPQLKTGLTPSVILKDNLVQLLNTDGSQALRLENPYIKIKLLPLLFKKLDITGLSAQNISAFMIYDKNKKLKLGDYPIVKPDKDLPFTPYKLKINTQNINVSFSDEIKNETIKLNCKYFIVNKYLHNKELSLSADTKISKNNKVSSLKIDTDIKLPLIKAFDNDIKINGNIDNLDLSDFSVYAASFFPDIKSLTGIINFTSSTVKNGKYKQLNSELSIDNLGIIKNDEPASVKCSDNLTLKSNIRILKNEAEIQKITLKAGDILLDAFGCIKNINSGQPDTDIKLNIHPSRFEKILQILPGSETLVPDINLYLLKKTGFWGNISGSLNIKGKTLKPDITGNITVDDAYLLKPIPNAEKALIKLKFIGQKTDIDVKVPTDKTQAVYVKGPVDLYNDKYGDLIITSTDSVDLKTAQIVLNPLHDILYFDIGPVPGMDIKGKGGINLHVKGTRKDPHGWGKFYFHNASVSFLGINNMLITNGKGTLIFDDQNTKFKSETANLNGKPISVEGSCTLLGELDFDVSSKSQELGKLLKIIKTSPMLADIQNMTKMIKDAKGPVDIQINLTGKVKDINDAVINKNLFAKGKIKLNSAVIIPDNFPDLSLRTSGIIDFDNTDADLNLISNINKSTIKIAGKIRNNICDIKAYTGDFHISDGFSLLPAKVKIPYKSDLSKITTEFTAHYTGKSDEPDLDKLTLKGVLKGNKTLYKNIFINSGKYEISNSVFNTGKLSGSLNGSPYKLSLRINNFYDEKKRVVNGEFNIYKFNLKELNSDEVRSILSYSGVSTLRDFRNFSGVSDIAARAVNNKLNIYTVIDNIKFLHVPSNLDIRLNSGSVLLNGNTLNLNKLNARIGAMPVFLNGKIFDIRKNPNLHLYINAKPTQEFLDQFFNNKSVYPIKMKGDIILSSEINGRTNNINTNSQISLSENSSIYYMGASLGDSENPVKILVNSNHMPERIKINNFKYDKIILSQNNKPFSNNQLTASGVINFISGKTAGFNNLRIKTQNPTDAKIFNIIFTKPLIKQGVFSSDLVLNGTVKNPKIRGTLDVTSIDMPFYDSTIKDINLNFKNDIIQIKSRANVLTNDVILNAVMKNKLTPPYIVENIILNLKSLDINKITDTLREIDLARPVYPNETQQTQPIDITQVIIKNADISADNVSIKNIRAENFKAKMSINEKMLADISDFKFNIAEGSVNGRMQYNLLNNAAKLKIHLNKANSAVMSEALFDLKNQIQGEASGDINLSCDGTSHDTCFRTITGDGSFNVENGKMPKLGSLEYLLKAGNLLKGGFTSLSINGLIDLITPLKTGDFKSISGDFKITDGTAHTINIYSKGKDLNLYITGSYNLISSTADMEIFGSLSKNITGVFGKVKNASLNTLFNTIPGLSGNNEPSEYEQQKRKIPQISDEASIYRIFKADVNGDINGDNYVKSFKWIK